MSKEIIKLLGHTIEVENLTGDIVDMHQLEEQIELGEKIGNVYWDGYIIPIGNFRVVNEDAETWKKVATDLYNAYTGTIEEDSSRDYVDAVENYRKAIKDQEVTK